MSISSTSGLSSSPNPVKIHPVYPDQINSQDEYVNDSCPICLDSMSSEEEALKTSPLVQTLCDEKVSHVFHTSCLLSTTFLGHTTCASCRRELDVSYFPSLIDVIKNNDLQALKVYLQLPGMSVNMKIKSNLFHGRVRLLNLAMHFKKVEIVKYLLGIKGIDVNFLQGPYEIPIYKFALYGDESLKNDHDSTLSILKLLVEHPEFNPYPRFHSKEEDFFSAIAEFPTINDQLVRHYTNEVPMTKRCARYLQSPRAIGDGMATLVFGSTALIMGYLFTHDRPLVA